MPINIPPVILFSVSYDVRMNHQFLHDVIRSGSGNTSQEYVRYTCELSAIWIVARVLAFGYVAERILKQPMTHEIIQVADKFILLGSGLFFRYQAQLQSYWNNLPFTTKRDSSRAAALN